MLHSKGIELIADGIEISTVVAGQTVVAGIIGNNRWVGGSTDKRNFIFEITDEGMLENRLSDNPIALVWGKPSASIIGPYRNRFHGIGLNQGNVVMIRNRHMLTLQVEGLQTGFWRWVAKTVEPSTKIQGVASFTYNKELTQEMGHRMEFARAGNVEAILDGRGLLHLRSLDSTLAELTMVIKEGITSGWTSDGCWFGSSFHCGTHPLTTASAIDRDVLQPILRGWQS